MKKILTSLIVILVTFIIYVALVSNNILSYPGKRNLRVVEPSSSETTNEVVDEALKGIGELYTMQYVYTMQSTTTDPMEIFGIQLPIGQKKLSYLYSGTLKVGVDLEKASSSVVGDTITVIFPNLIAENSYDEKSIQFYDVKQYSFTRKALENYQASRIANLDDIKQRAEELGIYEEAKDNLQSILEGQLNSILKQVGKGDNYHVNLIIESAEVDYEFDDE